MSQVERGAPAREAATSILEICASAADAYQRADLSERLAQTRARLVDPLFHVLVVGEFKQGKSSLINALLGFDVCPVDDDVATAVPTKLHHALAANATATVSPPDDAPEGSVSTIEQVPFDEVAQYVTEAANPDNRRRIESVDVGVPSPLLEPGLVLVDTPGVGGLGSTHSAITIGALPMADAVLFVSDASQEYTRPELDFLQTARSLCPNVGCVITKIDFYPSWRKIVDLDQGHLAAANVEVPVLELSSALRRLSQETSDAALDAESGFGPLEQYLGVEIVGKRESLVVRTAAAEMLSVVTQLESQFASERSALADPNRASELVHQLEIATDQGDRLRSTAARWQVTLNDGFMDLLTDVDHDLRSRLRQLTKDADDALDQSDPADSWEEFEPWLYRQAADHVVANYTMMQRRAGEIAARVSELFSIDGNEIAVQLDVPNPSELLKAVEASADVELQEGDGLSTGMSTLRSSYGGALMFGMFGQMVGLALINPVGVVAGIIFGGKAYRDEKNRALAQRRAQAKNAHRKYTDELAFQVGKDARDTVRRIQRQLRDQFTTRAEELYRSTTEALHKAQVAVDTDAKTRAKRLPDVEAEIARIRGLRDEVLSLAPDLASEAS
ncbi:MAG TPA: dynamin family protein [Acidimicrobiales bacterium]|nr:dynamin family protein [Acidimicrobiales bacterium]